MPILPVTTLQGGKKNQAAKSTPRIRPPAKIHMDLKMGEGIKLFSTY